MGRTLCLRLIWGRPRLPEAYWTSGSRQDRRVVVSRHEETQKPVSNPQHLIPPGRLISSRDRSI
jgi:hypothetical protein